MTKYWKNNKQKAVKKQNNKNKPFKNNFMHKLTKYFFKIKNPLK